MKKQIGLLVILSVLTISCGGKNEKKEVVKTEVSEIVDCGCGDIDEGKLNEKIFTGTCADKDQNDSIIKRQEFKNGYLIHQIERKKILNKYVTFLDMTYDNSEEKDGFSLEIGDYKEDNKEESNYYTRGFSEYKNGKLFNDWEIYINFNIDNGGTGDDFFQIDAKLEVLNGEKFQINGENNPSCFKDARTGDENTFWFNKDYFTFEIEKQALDCLSKSNDLKGFKIWKPSDK